MLNIPRLFVLNLPPCCHRHTLFSCFLMIQLHIPSVLVFLVGVPTPDSSKDLPPRSLNSTAPPPPPPPKNAARMLALALAESAQQVSVQSQPQSSGPPTLVSSVQPQVSHVPESSRSPAPPTHTASEEGEGAISSPPPRVTSAAVITSSHDRTTSSQPTSLPPSQFTSTTTKPSDSSATAQSRTQPEIESTPPSTPLYICAQVPTSTSLTSPTRKSPERQQQVTRQALGHSSSSGAAAATTPRCISKDERVLQQSGSEVNVSSPWRSELYHSVMIPNYSIYDKLCCIIETC